MVQEFIAAHPDVVSSLRIDRGPPAKLRILLWGDETLNVRTEILGSLHYPDDVVFDDAKYSPAHLQQVLEEIHRIRGELSPPAIWGSGLSWDCVSVQLDAPQERLAAQLTELYGDAVLLTVGNFPYSLDRPLSPGEARVPSQPPTPAPEPPGVPELEARLVLPATSIASGSTFEAEVIVTNVGATPVEYSRGAPAVSILDPAGHNVVGGFSGWVAGPGIQLALAPRESSTMKALTGMASGRRELGYVVPPGRYLARATLRLHPRRGGSPQERRVVHTPEIEIVIHDRNAPGG